MRNAWMLLFALLPVVATGAHLEVERTQGADVTADTSGYTALQLHTPWLDPANGYEDTLLDVTNGHPEGTVLDVQVVLLDDHDRFLLRPDVFTVGEGGIQTVEIVDEDGTPGNHTLSLRVEAEFLSSRTTGSSTIQRTVEVRVE